MSLSMCNDMLILFFKNINFRLSPAETRRGSSSIESGHSFRHGSYILLPTGARVCNRQIEDFHGMSSRRKLVRYVYS